MLAWLRPQSSAHWPSKTTWSSPSGMADSGILNQVLLVRPGTASILPPSLGIHQEWMTSSAVMSSVTVIPTGTTMST